jgi:hypothetical protein
METKEMSYNELVINGFMALFFNLVMLPALVFLNFLIFGQLPWFSSNPQLSSSASFLRLNVLSSLN